MMSSDTIERLIANGKGFQIQSRISIPASTMIYLSVDYSACPGKIYSRPITIHPDAGYLYVDTYGVDSITGGSTVTPLNLTTSANASASVCKSGVTPTGGPYKQRQYICGTKSTNQSSGGGALGDSIDKELSKAKILVIKLQNMTTDPMVIDYGQVWVES